MTLSRENFQRRLRLLILLLVAPVAVAMAPPDAQIAAAGAAIVAADGLHPQGEAAEMLDRARDRLSQSQALLVKHKNREALALADEAQACAALAQARTQRDQAQRDVNEKTARNADLRRQKLVLPESGQ